MGKHNKSRRHNRSGQIVVAAAAASVLAGWAAPVAYADDGADSDKGSNPVSRAAGAARDAVDSVRKTVTDVGSSLQGAASRAIQTGAGGAGTSTSLSPNSPKSNVSAQTNAGNQRAVTPNPAVKAAPSVGAQNISVPNAVALPDLPDLGLPGLEDLPGVPDLGAGGVGIPPSFGSQGSNNVPLGQLTNGNNLFGLNFYNIGDNNLFAANNLGTGLQGVFAGDRNRLAGNQVIVPTSFGTNFASMGDDNGNVGVNLPTGLDDLLNLDPTSILVLQPSGSNFVGSAFSYGNNTAIMGDGNQGTGNNFMLGTSNFGNNMHFIGDNADFSGNNLVAGIGSFGNNMSLIGDGSTGSGNNSLIGAGGFSNNMGLIGSNSDGSGKNSNTSPFGGFAQNFVLIGDGANGSGNNTNTSLFGGFAQNVALIGGGANGSGNNAGVFNFALVGSGVNGAGNNDGGGFNVAIFPGPGEGNCTGPACFNFFGTQFGS